MRAVTLPMLPPDLSFLVIRIFLETNPEEPEKFSHSGAVLPHPERRAGIIGRLCGRSTPIGAEWRRELVKHRSNQWGAAAQGHLRRQLASLVTRSPDIQCGIVDARDLLRLLASAM